MGRAGPEAADTTGFKNEQCRKPGAANWLAADEFRGPSDCPALTLSLFTTATLCTFANALSAITRLPVSNDVPNVKCSRKGTVVEHFRQAGKLVPEAKPDCVGECQPCIFLQSTWYHRMKVCGFAAAAMLSSITEPAITGVAVSGECVFAATSASPFHDILVGSWADVETNLRGWGTVRGADVAIIDGLVDRVRRASW